MIHKGMETEFWTFSLGNEAVASSSFGLMSSLEALAVNN